MPDLIELCRNVKDYGTFKNLKFAREGWKLKSIDENPIYVKIGKLENYSANTFIYFKNNKEAPLDISQYLQNDWYIIKEDENNVDLDIIENFKMRLINIVRDIDDFQYTILNEKNKRKVK